jgi:hypothetical protein
MVVGLCLFKSANCRGNTARLSRSARIAAAEVRPQCPWNRDEWLLVPIRSVSPGRAQMVSGMGKAVALSPKRHLRLPIEIETIRGALNGS